MCKHLGARKKSNSLQKLKELASWTILLKAIALFFRIKSERIRHNSWLFQILTCFLPWGLLFFSLFRGSTCLTLQFCWCCAQYNLFLSLLSVFHLIALLSALFFLFIRCWFALTPSFYCASPNFLWANIKLWK